MIKRLFTTTEMVEYFRMERDLTEWYPYLCEEEEFEIADFQVTKEDVIAALSCLAKEKSPELFSIWRRVFCEVAQNAFLPNKEPDLLKEPPAFYANGFWEDELRLVLGEMTLLQGRKSDFTRIKQLVEDVKTQDATRPYERRRVLSKLRMEGLFITYSFRFQTGQSMDSLPMEEWPVYKQIIEKKAKAGNADAIEMLAYEYCGGDRIYECDWAKSQELLLELMERKPEKKGQWANSLGCLYYSGHCNAGVPEYEKAYEYFTIGAAHGYYESIYKLADLYLNGNGTAKDEVAAFGMLNRIFKENYESFLRCSTNQKLAEIAFRIGNMIYQGQGTRANIREAYWYYLVAKAAIEKRVEEHSFAGDQELAGQIAEAVKRCHGAMDEQGLSEENHMLTEVYPLGIKAALAGGYTIHVNVTKIRGGIKLSSFRLGKEGRLPELIPLIFTKQSYCGFKETVTDYVGRAENGITGIGENGFDADEMRVMPERNLVQFYLAGYPTAQIVGGEYKLLLGAI